MFELVLRGKVEFKGPIWDAVSAEYVCALVSTGAGFAAPPACDSPTFLSFSLSLSLFLSFFHSLKHTRRAKDLVSSLLRTSPSERISAKQVLEHPWMTMSSSARLPVASRLQTFLQEENTLLRGGWLRKRGQIVKGWKRRFFALTSTTFKYFTDDKMDCQRGCIVLADVQNVLDDPKSERFDIVTSYRRYHLLADVPEDKRMWLQLIKVLVERHRLVSQAQAAWNTASEQEVESLLAMAEQWDKVLSTKVRLSGEVDAAMLAATAAVKADSGVGSGSGSGSGSRSSRPELHRSATDRPHTRHSAFAEDSGHNRAASAQEPDYYFSKYLERRRSRRGTSSFAGADELDLPSSVDAEADSDAAVAAVPELHPTVPSAGSAAPAPASAPTSPASPERVLVAAGATAAAACAAAPGAPPAQVASRTSAAPAESVALSPPPPDTVHVGSTIEEEPSMVSVLSSEPSSSAAAVGTL